MTRLLAILALAVTACACASIPQRRDAICSEVARFANSVPKGEKRTVRLETAWGSGLKGREDVLFEKQCDHAGYEPGRSLCRYLVENTSTEFMSINVSRILSCLPGAPPFRQVPGVSVHSLAGDISSWSFGGVREHTQVIIGFTTNCQDCDPHLEITANRPASNE